MIAMFVRFRQTPYGLQVSLIQARREGGKVRHQHCRAGRDLRSGLDGQPNRFLAESA
jgi:hypothetical protein